MNGLSDYIGAQLSDVKGGLARGARPNAMLMCTVSKAAAPAATGMVNAHGPAEPSNEGVLMKRILVAAALLLGAVTFACDGPAGLSSSQPEVFTATFSGSTEPAVTTNATSSAMVRWDPASRSFSYTLAASNITGVTAAHIHGPATTEQTAGILVPLSAPTTTTTVTGTFTAANIDMRTPRKGFGAGAAARVDSLLALMRNGRAYVDVHTTADQGGQVRGQLTRQ